MKTMNKDKIKKITIYALCVLCGIYSADMIFRIIRYVTAAKGDLFSKLIMVLGTAFNDGASFMILSLVCAVLIVASGLFTGVFNKRTIVAFAVNTVSCGVFMVVSNMHDAALNTVMYTAAISLPIYILSGLWCVYFSIKCLCVYFLNINSEENSK